MQMIKDPVEDWDTNNSDIKEERRAQKGNFFVFNGMEGKVIELIEMRKKVYYKTFRCYWNDQQHLGYYFHVHIH